MAEGGAERRKGLAGRASLSPGEALVISPCRQVHTFGMRFAIDVVFVDKSSVVLLAVHRLAPGRLSRVAWRARAAVEVEEGTLRRTGTRPGDVLDLAL